MFVQLILIFVIAVAAIAAIISLIKKYSRERTEALRRLSMENGFSFIEKGEKSFINELKPMKLFSKGSSKKIRNLFSKDIRNAKVDVFDYSYTTGGGQSQHTSKQTVVLFRSPKLKHPKFSLRPKNFFHKVGSIFGIKEIKFEANPAFTERFILKSDNEDHVRMLFKPQMLAIFESNKGISCDGEDDFLVLYRSGKRTKPEDMIEFINKGTEIFYMFIR